MADEAGPTVVIVAGVSGSGKTTVGRLLAGHLGWDFADADDFHPLDNVSNMRRGIPLSDVDRLPWLRDLAAWIEVRLTSGTPGVLACSLLKRAYRDLVIRDPRQVRLVYLNGDRDVIERRVTERKGHFFAAHMLDSQYRDLEPPGPDEHPIRASVRHTPEESVREIVRALALR
ncbi:gluconokinase [Thermomonospora umbrina]|uniref:Gluconokinase n=1 Tax=Thermomonospora umbrina TaxID=111806 RepID=A0A3D9T484_9ACTN|nr:gluconokinase [Thermomonospora umbrina]REE98631.1 gluconate kinase (SKI family) [Thermomonospora umbrina]